MTTALQVIPFTFDSHTIRSIRIEGEPWFHAADVCNALAHTNPSKAVADHVDPDDKSAHSLDLPGKAPLFVNESGLYALIFGSQLPAAQRFRKWVTKEVIPSIRKTGSYGTPSLNEAALSTLRNIHEAADREIEHRTRHDFYRTDSHRSQEHRAAVMAEVASKHHLGINAVSLAYAKSVDTVMAEVYADPIAKLRIERHRAEQLRIAQEYAQTVKAKRRSRRRRTV